MRWHFSDGTEAELLEGGLEVTGTSELAVLLRALLAVGLPRVCVVPPPGGCVPLDVRSAWICDVWLRAVASSRRVGVASTDYEPSDEDIPPEARELIEERRLHPDDGVDPVTGLERVY